MIDLPEANDRGRGCDAAWYLQMAIDASRGEPQRFRIRDGAGGQVVLDFFSPVPMWAQRRWDATGEPVAPSGSLVSYRFRKTEVAEEIGFLSSALWMQPVVMPGRAS
jgi:hypothetical protein